MARKSTYDFNRRRRKKRRNWLFEILMALFAVLLIFCAYAGKISPQSFFAAPFLTLAYMPMLLVLLLLLLISAFWRRWVAFATLIVSFVATLPVFSFYVPLNGEDNAPPMPADPSLLLKVMTYNVLSFNYWDSAVDDEKSETMSLILEADPDVVIMQEAMVARVDWNEIPALKPYVAQVTARYPYMYNSPEGLDILSKYPFTTQPIGEAHQARTALGYNRDNTAYLARAYDVQLPTGKQVRFIDFRLQSYHLSFGKSMNVRVSPDVKPAPLERMKRSFALRSEDAAVIRQAIDNSPGNVIVCGDMNDVPSSYVYRIIKGDDLFDAWKEVGNGYAHTFNRYHLPYRIDHIFYHGALQALNAKRLKGGSSDHYPLMVTFDIDVKENHIPKSNE